MSHSKKNLLAFPKPTGQREERKPDRKKSSPYAATINRIQPKVIKVCTGADMKKICPIPCDCRTVVPKRPGFMALLGLGMKMAFAAACVYVTYDMGVWGTNDDTQNLYRKFCQLRSGKKKPNDKWMPPSCVVQRDMFSPTHFKTYGHCEEPMFFTERTIHNLQNKWNRAVENVFMSIARLPNMITQWRQKKREVMIDEKLKCISFNDLPEEQKISNVYKRK